MEAIASEAATWTSSAHEAARRLGLPPSSVHNILRRTLQLYPYKLQSCHELSPADTAQREAFAKWAFSKMEQDPTWVFNILWTDEAHFSLYGDVNILRTAGRYKGQKEQTFKRRLWPVYRPCNAFPS
ncbi:uncharacterized protein TNCV_2105861 [Trichonephila clavipes]|nr:uncharacterized protein TNCV_2105861 [Trichonephila clavipes]